MVVTSRVFSGPGIVPAHGKDVARSVLGSVSYAFPENAHSTVNTSAYMHSNAAFGGGGCSFALVLERIGNSDMAPVNSRGLGAGDSRVRDYNCTESRKLSAAIPKSCTVAQMSINKGW